MTAFIDALTRGLNKLAKTENGAVSNESSLNGVLDFFSHAGALRGDPTSAVSYFQDAYAEDEELAMKALFYIRDIRGGQGERETFRTICAWLASNYPDAIIRNIEHIPTYGRWDDLYALVTCEETKIPALTFMKKQFDEDMASPSHVSLLGKWLKSENASSEETKRLGAITRKFFKLSARNYRKALATLRDKIHVVETYMSENYWDLIEYEEVPSNAMAKYTKAFNKHDSERFTEYLKSVARGEAKIHSATLYPYDIIRKVRDGTTPADFQAAECQWNALPNYLESAENAQAIVMADVSGSMYDGRGVQPIDVAISLALYFAERIKGPYANHFMTFSRKPQMVRIKGKTLRERCESISTAEWSGNTDLYQAFERILEFAEEHKVPKDQMPTKIFIISDMQFDSACDNDSTNFEAIDKLYKERGYERPQLVFWNVNGKYDDSPVVKDDEGTIMVSGCSPSILKHAMNTEAITPYEFMLDVLNSERYAPIH